MIYKRSAYHVIWGKYTSSETPNLELVLVVYEYPDMFLKYLSIVHPERETDFEIDFFPNTQPISILFIELL